MDRYRQMAVEGEKRLTFLVTLLLEDQAHKWLARNCNNRPQGSATIDRYAHYMVTGQWRLNGEPFILTADEKLLNGQHRLLAFLKACGLLPGLAIPVCLVIGVDEDAFKTMDQGKQRSGADTLSVLGKKHGLILSGALKWLHTYETDSLLAKGIRLSNPELVRLLNDFPEMQASVEYVHSKFRKGIHPPSMFAFLHYICTQKHPDLAEFFEQVLTGANVSSDSPAYVLNRKLEAMKGIGRSQAITLQMLVFIIKAWNATVNGQIIKVLKWAKEEPLPTIL